MVRVCREGGSVLIVTHGAPAKRMADFNSFEWRKLVDIQGDKAQLSDLSQLINLLRAGLKDKPLSHALKDKDLLTKAMKEGTIPRSIV